MKSVDFIGINLKLMKFNTIKFDFVQLIESFIKLKEIKSTINWLNFVVCVKKVMKILNFLLFLIYLLKLMYVKEKDWFLHNQQNSMKFLFHCINRISKFRWLKFCKLNLEHISSLFLRHIASYHKIKFLCRHHHALNKYIPSSLL